MRVYDVFKTGLAVSAIVVAAAASASEAERVDLSIWAETYAEIKAKTPKWSKQESDAFKASVDAGVPIWFLDLRTPKEWAEKGIIEDATLISLEDLATEDAVARLPADKSTIIGVYCSSGHRSALSLPLLRWLGYENVIVMADGYDGWSDRGFPVVTAPSEG